MKQARTVVGIKETFVNASKGYIFGKDECRELWTNDPKKLFHSLKKEYGPLCSRMYRDELQVNGTMAAVPIGYVFKGRRKYEDSADSYMREVWVEFIEEDNRP